MKDSSNGMISIAATDYKVLSGVDRIYQRSSRINNPNSACGPTVASMIVEHQSNIILFVELDMIKTVLMQAIYMSLTKILIMSQGYRRKKSVPDDPQDHYLVTSRKVQPRCL
ncbi:hypothetical protein AF2641_09540 [Anoxybacillus flavithermus]|nr:hypothetical protein AF2641_09540 [Anoxybacillus flavithermus]